MWYSILKINNQVFNICNLGSLPLALSVFKEDEEILHHTIDVDQNLSVTIPQSEGVYKIVISNRDNSVFYYVPKYPGLLEDLIKSIKKALNVKDCSNCNNVNTSEDTKETCKLLLETLQKCLFYYTLVGKYHCKYFNLISEEFKENLIRGYECNEMVQKILGNKIDYESIKKYISMFYLIFYYGEREYTIGSTYNKTLQEILDKFEFNAISPHLVGITSSFLDKLFIAKEGIFSIGKLTKDFNLNVRSESTPYVFTQRDFLNLTVPNYYSENNAEIESIKINLVVNNFESQFLYKNNPIYEGLVIPFNEIGKGNLKFYLPSKEYQYDSYSYFTFSVKTKTSEKYSKVSTCKMKIKWQEL